MKKLIGSLAIAVGLVGYSQAQFFDYQTITIPSACLQTNLIDGPAVVYEMIFDCTTVGDALTATNLNFSIHDSPRTNTPRSGTAAANILEFTNSGYTYYSGAFSNMNWLAAGSQPILGVNSNFNYAGVVTTITNSAALSNYFFTISNFQAGAVALRPIRVTGVALSNDITTVTFADGMRFNMGLTLTNKSGVAAIRSGYTMRVKYQPLR